MRARGHHLSRREPGRRGRRRGAGGGARRLGAGRGHRGGAIAADLARLRLETAIPAATARPFRVDPALSGGSVSVVSSGAGPEAVLSRKTRCTVLGRGQAITAFDCGVTLGSSGATMLRIDGARMRIVSIIVSGDRTEDGATAFGPMPDGTDDDLMDRLRRGERVWKAPVPVARRIVPGAVRSVGGARFIAP